MNGKQPRIVRLFVSSTFDDFREERERLRAEIFPLLAKKCRDFGVGFEVVDLRWGISSESSEQDTVEVCLGELQRCLATGLRPSFLMLLGDRYGWRPLPIEISTDAFDKITRRLEAGGRRSDADFLRRFYPLDENALTPCHRLVRADGQHSIAAYRKRIQAFLREGAAGLPDAERLRLGASTTELEIEHGLLRREGGADHALCCFRSLDRAAGLGAPWVDVENGKRNEDAAKRMSLLRRRVADRLGKDRRAGFRTRVVRRRVRGEWTRAVEESYLARFCAFVRRRLEKDLEDQLARLKRPPRAKAEIADEVAAHAAFAERNASLFRGRRSERRRLAAFLARPQKVPLIVSGESGIGKSALVAKAMRERPAVRRRTRLVERYLGATPASTRGESLVEGLLRQLGVGPRSTSSARMQQLKDHLENRKGPLILALDAVNQLEDGDPAENLQWLPTRLSGKLWLIVSAITGSRAERQLQLKYPNARRIRLSGLGKGESSALLDTLLAARGRRLRSAQKATVLEDHAADGSPLHLRIAAAEAARLRSDDPPWRPGKTVAAIVGRLLGRLSAEGSFGKLFVSRSLAYLASSRHGLSHDEIRHVLWRDRHVRREYRHLHRFSPKRSASVAPLVWARLFRELFEFLAFRYDQGEEVIGFFHDRVREAVERQIRATDRPSLHGGLAGFFVPRRKEPFRPRAFSELVYQLARAGSFQTLTSILGRADFVAESLSRHGTIPLTVDIDSALALMAKRSPDREPLEALRRSLAQSTHAIGESRGDVATQLLGRLSGQHPSTRALLRGLLGMVTGPWLRPLSGSLSGSGLERVLDLRPRDDIEVPPDEDDPGRFQRIWDIDLCPDRRTVLAAVGDGTVQMWDIRSGRLIAALVGHQSPVESVCASSDGETAASVGNRQLIVWDLVGREILRDFPSRNRLFSVTITHRGDRIITGAGKGQITVWDAFGKKPPWTVRPHKDLVWRLAVSMNDRYVASASQDGRLVITHLRTRKSRVASDAAGDGELMRAVQLTSDGAMWLAGSGSGRLAMGRLRSRGQWRSYMHEVVVRDMAISSDDKEVASVSQDGVLAISTVPGLIPALRVKAHSNEVNTVHLAADGRSLLTGSSDGFIKLWDLDTMKGARQQSRHFFPIVYIGTLNNGRHVVSACSEGRVFVWDSRSFRQVRSIELPRMRIHQMEIADKERLLVYVAGLPYGDPSLAHLFSSDEAQIRVRDLRTGSEWSAETGSEGRDSRFAVVPGSPTIFSTADQHHLALSDLRTGKILRRIRNVGYHLEQILITPDKRRLVVVSWSSETYNRKRVLVFDLRTGRRERVLVRKAESSYSRPRPRTGALRPIALLGSRRAVAGFESGRIRVWDLHTGELQRQFDAHEGGVSSIEAIGRRVLSTGADGHVRIWDARLWHERPGLEGPVKGLRYVRLSQGGRLFVGVSDDWSLLVWDRRTKKLLASFTANEKISCYRLLPDERTIVVGEETGGLHLLRLER